MRGLGTRLFGGSRVPVNRRSRGVGATAITPNAPIWSSGPNFTVTELVAYPNQALPVYANGSPITITWVAPGSQPSWITFSTAQANPTITFTGGAGQIDSADISGMVLRATADGISVDSSSAGTGSVTITSASVTYSPSIGFDVPVSAGSSEAFYNRADIVSDGTFMWWCVGGHGQNDDNAVHGFNPWPTSRTDATGQSRSALSGWHRWPTNIGNYVSQYDNYPHWNLNSANLWVTPALGVYNVADANTSSAWVAGSIPPSTTNWKSYVRLMTQNDIDANYFEGRIFNPHCVWVEALDCMFVAGGEASGGPLNYFWKLERTLPSEGYAEPWKLTRYNAPALVNPIGTTPNVGTIRNLSVAVGPYVYFACEDRRFFKVDVRDMTTVTQLTSVPAVGNNYYYLMTYDERRKKILWIGRYVYSYDIAANTWTEITPGTWNASYGVMGAYHRELDAHYFRAFPGYAYGDDFGTFQKNAWHKIYLGNPTNNPRWRSQTVGASPFKGLIENGSGQNKHVSLAWHPVKKRLYNCGGDFGYTSSQSPFFQPEPGQTVATNQPSGAHSYAVSDSLRTDMYSLDPLASGTQDWRLEHPLYPRNISGSPEQKPGYTDQVGWVWDDRPSGVGGQKFWCFQHHIRDDQAGCPKLIGGSDFTTGGTLDPWANGDVIQSSVGDPRFAVEGQGTYSWTPSANGGAGTWVKETDRYMWGDNNYSNPAQVGNALRIYSGSGDHFYCGTWAQYKPASDGRFISLFGDAYSTNLFWMTTFDPVAKTYDWRKLSFPAQTLCWSWIGPMVIIDDYAYVTALTRHSGVRKSQLLKIHIPTALSYAAGSTLPSSLPQFVDCPFSFEPDGLWESAGTGGNLFHEVGLVGIDRKLVLIGSYGATLVKPSGTRIATYVHDTGRWVSCDAFPGTQYNSKCWVAIPETGEVLMMPNSSGDDNAPLYSPHNTYWYYRVR